MGRNTAQAGQRWSRRGPKPEPVAPSWETLGMAVWDGESDDPACTTAGCYAVRDDDVTLHAYPNGAKSWPTGNHWTVFIVGQFAHPFPSEAAAFDFCRRLLALPPTNKENA